MSLGLDTEYNHSSVGPEAWAIWTVPMAEFIDVDPGELHLPPSRPQGADPGKLARQIARHGDLAVLLVFLVMWETASSPARSPGTATPSTGCRRSKSCAARTVSCGSTTG